jgi:hypothetical protein
MTVVVRAAPRVDWPWLVMRTGCALTTDFSAVEAIRPHPRVEGEYRILGMVGYCNTTPNAIQVHIAVESPLAWRALLLPALEYPFIQAKKGIIIGVIPANNKKPLAFGRHLGFKETHRIKDGWAEGTDLVFLELRREHCRFLRRVQTERAA